MVTDFPAAGEGGRAGARAHPAPPARLSADLQGVTARVVTKRPRLTGPEWGTGDHRVGVGQPARGPDSPGPAVSGSLTAGFKWT